MTAVVPSIHIYNKTTQLINRPGMASKIAVVGAFDSEITNPQSFLSVGEAQQVLGTDSTFNGCTVIEDLFYGASSLLAVNITTWTGTGNDKTADKSLTTAKLTSALAKIKGEDFDILFIAETLTDTFLPIIDTFLDETFEMKYPAGYIGVLNGETSSANVTSAGLAGEHCYGLLTQSGDVGGVTKSLLQFGAYYCGVVAGMNVGNTMTQKIVPYVTSITPELSFETGSVGKAYVEAGLTTLKCQNRAGGNYIVVNSEQPNGYDLYVNRVRDYVVKEMSLHQFLGDRNRNKTHSEIEQELNRVKNKCVNVLDLLEDINFTVQKKDANCVDIYIDSLVFAGIITRIDVYVKLEVQ